MRMSWQKCLLIDAYDVGDDGPMNIKLIFSKVNTS